MSVNPVPKPGPHVKKTLKTPYVKKREIEPPPKKHCRLCLKTTETEAFRHYEGRNKHKYGKGMGKKVNDSLTVWACMECDKIISTKPDKDAPKIEHLEFELLWFELIIETHLF